ncbi:hypothetical protein DFH08DRAFT_238343 [Mycena albidolilacea]|uniref:Uncharacterized protein n=1 Tax=Mycena albidolilacea TaxID=1033008 RepID=A0AAD6ZXJ8_9AGAR|nr:hypothetical protein DFH08DRAFT_238343 [Mycena albidolilacea]
MNIDIDECSKALNAHEERSYFTQLRKASSWNKELSGYANRFTKRREDLLFALNLQTATAVAKIDSNVTEMVGKFSMFDRMVEKFSAFDDLAKMVKKCFEGSHSRVKERMVASVWKRQGWANTATTSKLVSGISKYFVDQSTYSLPTNPNEDDGGDNDSETDISVPLYSESDSWVTNYRPSTQTAPAPSPSKKSTVSRKRSLKNGAFPGGSPTGRLAGKSLRPSTASK